MFGSLLLAFAIIGENTPVRTYENRLVPVEKPRPILADYPLYVEPLGAQPRFLAPPIVDEPKANLEVRAWRFSYNARGIIEMPNHLVAAHTAVIVVHPWGIDDGQGWNSPEPAGVAMFCTPEKNRLYHKHIQEVVNPFLKSLRGKVGLVAYSLPGKEDAIRRKVYRSIRTTPTEQERRDGGKELAIKLKSFNYKGDPLSATFSLDPAKPAADYFKKFPGLDAGPKFDPKGFWELPIPVVKGIDVDPKDVVIYDGDGYPPLRDFLKKQGIRHVLLAGYATDMCVCSTTAGYKNLAPDFNLFVVGDATLATFPAAPTPKHATQAALGLISLEHLVTQVSWIRGK
jgi:nicotinamidase-related amidase